MALTEPWDPAPARERIGHESWSAKAGAVMEELESMVASGDTNEINCDYCGTTYAIGPEKLRTLLTSS